MANRGNFIEDFLKGADLKSIRNIQEVGERALNDPVVFEALINSVLIKDPVLSMGTTDVAKKISKNFPPLIEKHRKEILNVLKNAKGKQLRWHLALVISHITWDKSETVFILNTLLKWYRTDLNKIVQINCLDALCSIALKHQEYEREIRLITEEALLRGAPSLRARAKKLLRKFESQKNGKNSDT